VVVVSYARSGKGWSAELDALLADYSLDQVADVDLSGASDGKFLKRSSGVWVPANIASGDVSGLGSAATKDAGAAGAAGKVLNADDPTTSDTRTPTDASVTPAKTSSSFADAFGRRVLLPGLVGPMLPLGFPQTQLAVAVTANRAYFARIVPSTTIAITSIIFLVSVAAGSNDACDVGVYDASWSRLRSAGATSGKLNSQGVQSVAITSLTLTVGTVYYLALSTGTQGSTAASIIGLTSGATAAKGMSMFGTTAPNLLGAFLDTAHPLPNPATTPASIASPVTIAAS
jgi:hypothetical protein